MNHWLGCGESQWKGTGWIGWAGVKEKDACAHRPNESASASARRGGAFMHPNGNQQGLKWAYVKHKSLSPICFIILTLDLDAIILGFHYVIIHLLCVLMSWCSRCGWSSWFIGVCSAVSIHMRAVSRVLPLKSLPILASENLAPHFAMIVLIYIHSRLKLAVTLIEFSNNLHDGEYLIQ